MWRFIGLRVLQAIPVLLVVITATFFLVRVAPGGPFDSEKAVIPEVKAALEAQYGLNQPLWRQYTAYLGDLAQGDLGPSFKYPGRSVNELIAAGFPVTAELGLYALLVALVIGGVAGIIAVAATQHGAGLRADVRRHDRHLHAVLRARPAAGPGVRHLSGLAAGVRLGR